MFGGSLWPRHWRPRFWSSPAPLESKIGVADLTTTTAADFAGFLGVERRGIVSGLRIDPDWSAHPPALLWNVPVGAGWSGIAAVNGYAVTMQQNGDQECITCFRMDDGSIAWNHVYNRRQQDVLGGVGPRSTPTIHDGRVYALGAMGDLNCLDGNTGAVVWSVNLLDLAGIGMQENTNARGEHYQVEKSNVMWGRAASPLVYKDRVIVPLGGPAALIAFDAATGAELWRGGDQPIGYSSPTVGRIDDRDQILIVNESSVSGHDPASGAELWRSMRGGRSNGDANTSQATEVGQNRVLVSKGYGTGGELLSIGLGDDGRYRAESLWSNPRVLRTKLTNPIVDPRGYIYDVVGWDFGMCRAFHR